MLGPDTCLKGSRPHLLPPAPAPTPSELSTVRIGRPGHTGGNGGARVGRQKVLVVWRGAGTGGTRAPAPTPSEHGAGAHRIGSPGHTDGNGRAGTWGGERVARIGSGACTPAPAPTPSESTLHRIGSQGNNGSNGVLPRLRLSPLRLCQCSPPQPSVNHRVRSIAPLPLGRGGLGPRHARSPGFEIHGRWATSYGLIRGNNGHR